MRDISPFCGAVDIPLLDFWWWLPKVSKPCWISFVCASSATCNGFLRFTSSAIPADLLTASIATEPFLSTYLYTYLHWRDLDLESCVRHSVRTNRLIHSGWAHFILKAESIVLAKRKTVENTKYLSFTWFAASFVVASKIRCSAIKSASLASQNICPP